MNELLVKYANLLTQYCLSLKEGDKLYISTTTLAEPLVKEVYRAACKLGVLVEVNMSFADANRILYDNAPDSLLNTASPFQELAINEFDAYLVIRAPFNLKEDLGINKDRQKLRSKATANINQTYFDRTADGSMKRCLCQFPTQAAAQEAGMSLEEYSKFVFNACKLFEDDDPIKAWTELGKNQQYIVDYLNKADHIIYRNPKSEISFSVKDRIWINSDGKANMPSGEVYTGPIENSVNGHIHFDYPSIYSGNEVKDFTFHVENGIVQKWTAGLGQEFLDHIFSIEGTRMFGEVAIGTNYGITQATKNILFDEKIGGTVHMAIGQSYKQTGGVNQSTVHWDMIADMKEGEILADDKLIYENGHFII
jgi:aminopeptidase